MKTSIKMLFGILFSLIFSFTCIGYAALTTTLNIVGAVDISAPEGIYITNIELVGTSNATSKGADYVSYSTSAITTISKTSSNRTGSVTYKITVWNNTPYKYAYSGIVYSSSTEGGYNGNSSVSTIAANNKISITTTINTSTSIEPGEKLEFEATYTMGRSLAANRDYKTLVNYKFGVNIDSVGDVAIDVVLNQFGSVLNDDTPGGAYETLCDKIDDKFDGINGWKTNYIGNVADSTSQDSQTINALFQGKLQLTVDGKETNVTLLIKREDVDGDLNTGDSYTSTHPNGSFSASGCEMTIYMTVDPLNRQGAAAEVYAAVFTCHKVGDTYGDWYMLGDMYLGTATIVGYEGGESTGSFNTETWLSKLSTYTVSDDYQYTVGNNNTIQTVIQAADRNASNKLRNLLAEAKAIIDANEYAGQAMVQLTSIFNEASHLYTVSGNGTITINNNTTRADAVPVIKSLEIVLRAFDGL